MSNFVFHTHLNRDLFCRIFPNSIRLSKYFPNHCAPQMSEHLDAILENSIDVHIYIISSVINTFEIVKAESGRIKLLGIPRFPQDGLFLHRNERKILNRELRSLKFENNGQIIVFVHWLRNAYYWASCNDEKFKINIVVHENPCDALKYIGLTYIPSLIYLCRAILFNKNKRLWTVSDSIKNCFLLKSLNVKTIRNSFRLPELPNAIHKYDCVIFVDKSYLKGYDRFSKFCSFASAESIAKVAVIGLEHNNSVEESFHYYYNLSHKESLQILQCSNNLIHFSRSEALPSTIIEARALGLRVFCGDVGDILNLYKNDNELFILNFCGNWIEPLFDSLAKNKNSKYIPAELEHNVLIDFYADQMQ